MEITVLLGVMILIIFVMEALSEVCYGSGRQSLLPRATFSFNVGDKIIATVPHPQTGDRSYRDWHIIIREAGTHHIVYEWTSCGLEGVKSTMTIEDVKAYKFIPFKLQRV